MALDREKFREIMALCFGSAWQTDLANALGVNIRTVQRWASGQTPIPAQIWKASQGLCAARALALARMADELGEWL
jgi:DNA-binding transcriptional regulator YdaS (Cro superfamily)